MSLQHFFHRLQRRNEHSQSLFGKVFHGGNCPGVVYFAMACPGPVGPISFQKLPAEEAAPFAASNVVRVYPFLGLELGSVQHNLHFGVDLRTLCLELVKFCD